MMMKGSVVAIGSFDGVHLGHQTLLKKLSEIAYERYLQPLAITFKQHPLSILAPEKEPPVITELTAKIKLMEKMEVEPIVMEFTKSLSETKAKEWLFKLKNEFNTKVLLMGYDSTFGCDGKNLSPTDYKRLGQETGIEILEAPMVPDISSSNVRKAISEGEIERASELMGHNFEITGKVVKGNQIGRSIGFPTANILPENNILLPKQGVYVASVFLPDGSTWPAMVNVGCRPTIESGNNKVVETHIIGWDGNLYDQEIVISFISRMRDEKKFDSINDLSEQLLNDKRKALLILDKREN